MIQNPTPFQAETVKATVSALNRRRGPGRFLVADEVGLGKTVVARNVIQELADRAMQRERTFTVFYFASNLDLLEQNRKSILKAASGHSSMIADHFHGDRLGAYLEWQPKSDAILKIAVFTPGTSLPDRAKGAAATGTRDERALAVALANLTCPGLINQQMRMALAVGTTRMLDGTRQRRAFEDFESRCRWQRSKLLKRTESSRQMMLRMFSKAIAHEFNFNSRAHAVHRRRIIRELFAKSGLGSLRSRLRAALCRAALWMPTAQPDLVILDEFQRYRDLLEERDDSLAGVLFQSAKVLLLSATPFSQPRSHMHSHPLADLVKFLYSKDGDAMAAEVEHTLKKYRQLIAPEEGTLPSTGPDRDVWTQEVIETKEKLERLLRPVIERTERRDDSSAAGIQSASSQTGIEVEDLRTFDDFAARLRAAARRKRHRHVVSHATPLWMSVPYPVQTLPSGYVAAAALQQARGIKAIADVPRLVPPAAKKPPSTLQPATAHPKVRSLLQGEARIEEFALPWMRPSLPWWQMAGLWEKVGPSASKSLVFSHFRATPPAIGAIISREVERLFGSRRVGWNNVPRQGRFAVGARNQPLELLALFYPWTSLALLFDPCGPPERTINEVLTTAHARAEEMLHSVAIKIKKRKSKVRSIPALLAHLEERLGDPVKISSKCISDFAPLFTSEKAGIITEVSFQDVANLARYIVGAPGVVLLRALRRHFNVPSEESQQICESELLQSLSWGPLRLYLGRRYFERAIPPFPETSRRASRHADRMGLLDAVIAGNLESVFDEQFFALRRIGSIKRDNGAEVLKELKDVLALPAGSLSLHHVVRGKRRIRGRLRAHAAVAFSGQEAGGTKTSKFRPESLRSAFNSPFWPHVLTTTAVGQEGLDFHLWCRRIVHWDLPPDPLALEQREGRIMRYACLSVRRALARQHGCEILASESSNFSSPWLRLGTFVDALHSDAAKKQSQSGLTPWWVTPEGIYERILPTPIFSRDDARFQKLLSDLDIYRLAIGQPNPEQFVSRVEGKLNAGELRAFAVDLSSARLRSSAAIVAAAATRAIGSD